MPYRDIPVEGQPWRGVDVMGQEVIEVGQSHAVTIPLFGFQFTNVVSRQKILGENAYTDNHNNCRLSHEFNIGFQLLALPLQSPFAEE